MALFNALLAALFQSSGRILNTLFGWATAMLFGRVSQKRQYLMSVLTFGSVLWLLAVVGSFSRESATALLEMLLPKKLEIYDRELRVAMSILALALPAVLGAVGVYMQDDPQERVSAWKALLRGYPFTFGLGLTLLLMMLFAPIIKIRDISKGWHSVHIPVLVPPRAYMDTVVELEDALKAAGFHVTRSKASWMLVLPTRVLSFFAGDAMQGMVGHHLAVLRSQDLEMQVHPSDLIVSGKDTILARARSTVAEKLTFSAAYLTWTKEGNELECKIKTISQEVAAGKNVKRASTNICDFAAELDQTPLSYEEWEILYRLRLQAEHLLLNRIAPAGIKKAA